MIDVEGMTCENPNYMKQLLQSCFAEDIICILSLKPNYDFSSSFSQHGSFEVTQVSGSAELMPPALKPAFKMTEVYNNMKHP